MKQLRMLLIGQSFAILACNNPASSSQSADSSMTQTASSKSLAANLSGCYEYNIGQDTIRLTLKVDSNLVSGTLFYDMYEKDKAKGTLKGIIKDSLIETSYHFNAEGMDSESEILFQFKNDSLYMGEGAQSFKDGKTIFQDHNKVQFKTAFRKISCP
jgi:hypothetical protein